MSMFVNMHAERFIKSIGVNGCGAFCGLCASTPQLCGSYPRLCGQSGVLCGSQARLCENRQGKNKIYGFLLFLRTSFSRERFAVVIFGFWLGFSGVFLARLLGEVVSADALL